MDALHTALNQVAPGTQLREGLDRIVRAKMGALVVVGDGAEVLNVCSGGFLLDARYSPQRLSELAKMDGAIILAADGTRIARANVHLVPDPSVPTAETGTRHRTAERVARHLRHVPVISVSEETKHVLQEIPRLLDKGSQALQTLGRYSSRLEEATSNLAALEVEDLVTLRDVAAVVQRAETVRRIAEEIEMMIIELGVDARLLRLQLDELYGDTSADLSLVIRDYLPTDAARSPSEVLAELSHVPDEQLNDLLAVANTMRLSFDDDLDRPLAPRGYRLLAEVPRVSPELANEVINRFGTLTKVMRATVEDLSKCPGLDIVKAKAIKDGLARRVETSILDQYG
jgi:diadenylate cyclase